MLIAFFVVCVTIICVDVYVCVSWHYKLCVCIKAVLVIKFSLIIINNTSDYFGWVMKLISD